MSYRKDADLEFLGLMSSNDLSDLAHCLIYDRYGKPHMTQSLNASSEYRIYGDDYAKYWKRIAQELQVFGANSIVSFFRGGKGVKYHEILSDVCKSVGVGYDQKECASQLEKGLISSVFSQAIYSMDNKTQLELRDELKSKNIVRQNEQLPKNETQSMDLINRNTQIAYYITLAVVNAVWKMLFRQDVNQVGYEHKLSSLDSISAPLGWMLTSLNSTINLTGPAYRITIPAVFQVALLRGKFLNSKPYCLKYPFPAYK